MDCGGVLPIRVNPVIDAIESKTPVQSGSCLSAGPDRERKMIKKTDKSTEREKLIAVGSVAEIEVQRGTGEHQPTQREVNLMIHGWLTDMWLLTTGEELDDEGLKGKPVSHGRPLAFASDGQLRLLGSRSKTLEALRDVGIEMS
jgi:hypothetical protein